MTRRMEHRTVDGVELKHCACCEKWLPLAQYCKNSQCWDRLHKYCRSCLSKRGRAYRQANPEQVRATSAAWYREHSEEHKAGSVAWRKEHLEAAHAIERTYRETHREVSRVIEHRRRARLEEASGAAYTTLEMLKGRWDMYGGRCWICGDSAEAMDHVKPLAKGGGHWPCNLRPICTLCNSQKGSRWPYEVRRCSGEADD